MSAAPDPAELAPSRDPAAYGRRRLLTVSFFAWVSLCLICLITGVALGRLGAERLAVSRLETAPPTEAAPRPAPAVQPTPAPSPTPAAPVASDGAAVPDALDSRLSRLETASGRLSDAALDALAAATLSASAASNGPFDRDLVALRRLRPDDPDLRALASLAAEGAPSRAALAADLPPLASEAAAAAREPPKNAGILQRFGELVSRVIVVRRIDPKAPGADGTLARAERAASVGDLEGALAELQTLSGPARAPLGGWIAQAQRRAEIDRRIAALRTRALDALAQPGETS
jgi:hypothetical protein